MRTPKLVSAEPTKTGVESPPRNDTGSTSAPTASSRPISSWATCQAAPSSTAATSAGTSSSGDNEAPRSVRVKRMYVARASIDDTAQVAGDADRPRRRGRPQPDLGLDLVEQLERFAARTVVLVEEGQHGQAAGAADLEQLQRLGLDALGGVEHHHDGVDAGEHSVGVLGEVPVARRVEQVDDVVAVRELEHRRADRDAPLALELHPVRRRGPPPVAGLDGAGSLYCPGIEQELLGERGLAGVGMADDGERAAPGRLLDHLFTLHDPSTLSVRPDRTAGCTALALAP